MAHEQNTREEGLTAGASATPLCTDENLDTFDIGEDDFEAPEQLPRRPRRRLLAPVPVALTIALMSAVGFIGGVLVEKGQVSSTSSQTAGTGLAGRFAALRGGRSGSSGTGAAGASSFPGAGTGGTATVGQVSFLRNGTLYVSTAEGNTVRVRTSAGSTVTKTVKARVRDIHPGETVVVTGTTGASGSVSAESIRVSEAGASGGLGTLLGGGGRLRSGSGSTPSGGGGEPALFGK